LCYSYGGHVGIDVPRDGRLLSPANVEAAIGSLLASYGMSSRHLLKAESVTTYNKGL